MKTFLINLDRSPERLELMDARLKALGITYKRIRAVDGRDLPPLAGSRLSATERGCLLSHIAVWNTIAAGDEPCALVLEDDVLLSPHLPALVHNPTWVPADAALVKLETTNKTILVDATPAATRDGVRIVGLRSPHMGSAAYVISIAAARSLATRQLDLPVDMVLFDARHGKPTLGRIYQADPALSRQDGESASFIRTERKQFRREQRNIIHRQWSKTVVHVRRFIHAVGVLAGGRVTRKPIAFLER
jgi:glycosyl transferase family 25